MKKIYESFEEIAEDFVNGDHWTHQLDAHESEQCACWQESIGEFAKWLDRGIKLKKQTVIYDKLWELTSEK